MSDVVRVLAGADATLYHAIRAQMLLDAPWAFGSDPEHDRFRSMDAVLAALANPMQAIVGAFRGERLLSVAGVMREERPKRRHIASIWGVFTVPEARGQGLSRRVMEAAVEHARSWSGVETIQLAVSERAPAAQRVYRAIGFVPWGVEPAALRVGGETFAEIHMSLRLV